MNKPKNARKNRRILGSRAYRDYSQEILELAVDNVKNNWMSSREAEKRFGIPRRTILNKVTKNHTKLAGGQKKFTDEEEEKLVNVLLASADYGSPMTKIDLKMLVFKYIEKNSRTDLFDGKLPSDTWVERFLSRHHSKLTIRTTQNIKKVRAEKGITEMEQFYTNLSETLNDVPPTNILNYDETNLSDNPGTSKCEITGELIEREEMIEMDIPSSSYGMFGQPALLPQFSDVIYNPVRLDVLCMKFINMRISPAHVTDTQLNDVCVLNKKMKSDSQNRPFIAHDENDIPGCIRSMSINSSKSKVIITSNVKVTPKEMKDIKKKNKLGTKVNDKSALQMKLAMKKVDNKNRNVTTGRKRVAKRKRLRSISETSSESDITFVSDESDCETFDDYLSTYLEQIENKENFEPEDFSDISYYTSNVIIKQEDWVIVKFTTKKSVKHFVGRVLCMKNSDPTVKFVRKVKNTKDDKVIFTYPNVEDVSEVNHDDVEMVLPAPNISRRGQIMFNIIFNRSYNLQ